MNAQTRIDEFRRAVSRLREALALADDNPLGVDASIQRFEFCVELAWKSLREILLRDHGVDVASPKTTFRGAWQVDLIDDETAWLTMLEDRNLSTHTYRQALAMEIFSRLPRHLAALEKLAASI